MSWNSIHSYNFHKVGLYYRSLLLTSIHPPPNVLPSVLITPSGPNRAAPRTAISRRGDASRSAGGARASSGRWVPMWGEGTASDARLRRSRRSSTTLAAEDLAVHRRVTGLATLRPPTLLNSLSVLKLFVHVSQWLFNAAQVCLSMFSLCPPTCFALSTPISPLLATIQ